MFDDRVTMRIGAVVSALLGLAVVLALQYDFRDLGRTISVRVYMAHPGPLRADDDVQLGGRTIGRIRSIRLVTSNEARKSDHLLYPRGGVVLDVQIRKKYQPWLRLNSELFVNAKGIIGESYLEIAPPPGEQKLLRTVRDGDAIRGIDPARMEHIIVTSFLNARRFGALLDDLRPSLDKLRLETAELIATINALQPKSGSYQQFSGSISRVKANLSEIIHKVDLGDPSLSDLYRQAKVLQNAVQTEMGDIAHDLRALRNQIDALSQRMPKDMGKKFAAATLQAQTSIKTLNNTIHSLQLLMARVDAGMGTIGALINDEEFVDDRKRLGRYIKRHPWKFLTRPLDR